MPIRRLLSEDVPPEEVERLDRAFTFMLHSLYLVDCNDPICDIVARKVIEIDKARTHDPQQIAKLAARELGTP